MNETDKEKTTSENFNHLENQKVGNLPIEVWNNILRQRNVLEQNAQNHKQNMKSSQFKKS